MSTTFWLTLYVLVWPAIVAGTLFVIMRAFFRDLRKARRRDETII